MRISLAPHPRRARAFIDQRAPIAELSANLVEFCLERVSELRQRLDAAAGADKEAVSRALADIRAGINVQLRTGALARAPCGHAGWEGA